MKFLTELPPGERGRLLAWLLAATLALLGVLVFNSPLNQLWLLHIHSSYMGPDALWSFVTQFGEGGAAFLLLIIAAQFTQQGSALVIKSYLLGSLLSPLLKSWVASPRPLGVVDLSLLHTIGTPPSGANSMPSGHAMTAAAAISLLLYMSRHLRHRPVVWLGLLLFGSLVAFSRVVIGAHWPADVLVGCGLGVAVALLAMAWEARMPWSPKLQTRPFQFALMLVELGLVIYLLKAKTDTEAARLAFDLMATIGIAGAMNRWISLRRNTP